MSGLAPATQLEFHLAPSSGDCVSSPVQAGGGVSIDRRRRIGEVCNCTICGKPYFLSHAKQKTCLEESCQTKRKLKCHQVRMQTPRGKASAILAKQNYKLRHPLRYQTMHKNAQIKKLRKWKARVYEMLGGKCAHCGNADLDVLCIDHVAGNGHAERKRGLTGQNLHRKILKLGTDGYQLLCCNCNMKKAKQNGEIKTASFVHLKPIQKNPAPIAQSGV